MAEKILSTRIMLKYDTYENWVAKDPVLKKGELALVAVSTEQSGTANYVPSIMTKCGDGTHKFSELGWVYARSSDTYSWAKAATKPTYTADEISGLSDYISGEIQDTDTTYNIRKVNDYQYQLQSKSIGDESFTDVTGAVINIPDDTSAISALQTLVGETAVATQIANAIAALKLADTYEVKGSAAAVKTELLGTDTDTADSNTIKGTKKYADSLNTAMDTRVDALEAAIGEGGSVATQIATEINKLDKADTAVSGQYVSAVSEANGVITVTRKALPDYTDTYASKTHTHAIADVTDLQTALNAKAAATDVSTLSDKVTTLVGSDADKSVRTIANEELAAQLIPESAKESLDTLSEIAAWIQSHPDDASAMNDAISALETKVGNTAVSAQITAAIDALKVGDIKDATDRISALEADTHTHANKALLDTYTQTEANLADAVAKKHSHANKTVLDGITSAKVTAWDKVSEKANDADLATIAKTGNINDLVQTTGDVIVFDCGSATVNI